MRPLSVGEVLDVAINVYLRHAGTLFRVVLVVVAPVEVVSSLVQLSALPDAANRPALSPPAPGETQPIRPDEVWTAVAGFGVVFLLAFVAGTIATGACFKAVADAYLGEQPAWRSSLRFALARVHSILWVTILGGILVVLGLLLCVLPGIWLWIAFAVAVPVLLTEGVKGRRALGRSRRLVKGRWWQTFALVLIGYLLASIATAVLAGLVEATALTDVGETTVAYFTLSTVANVVASVLTTPFIAAFVTVLYFDLRVRKEGFDLELLAERIGLEPDPSRRSLAPPPGPAGQGAEGPWPPAPGAPLRPDDATHGADPSRPPYWPPPPGWKPPGDGPEGR